MRFDWTREKLPASSRARSRYVGTGHLEWQLFGDPPCDVNFRFGSTAAGQAA